MLGQTKVQNFTKLKIAMENDIVGRFPNIAKHINAINIDNARMSPLSADIKSAGIGMAVDASVISFERIKDGFPHEEGKNRSRSS